MHLTEINVVIRLNSECKISRSATKVGGKLYQFLFGDHLQTASYSTVVVRAKGTQLKTVWLLLVPRRNRKPNKVVTVSRISRSKLESFNISAINGGWECVQTFSVFENVEQELCNFFEGADFKASKITFPNNNLKFPEIAFLEIPSAVMTNKAKVKMDSSSLAKEN